MSEQQHGHRRLHACVRVAVLLQKTEMRRAALTFFLLHDAKLNKRTFMCLLNCKAKNEDQARMKKSRKSHMPLAVFSQSFRHLKASVLHLAVFKVGRVRILVKK